MGFRVHYNSWVQTALATSWRSKLTISIVLMLDLDWWFLLAQEKIGLFPLRFLNLGLRVITICPNIPWWHLKKVGISIGMIVKFQWNWQNRILTLCSLSMILYCMFSAHNDSIHWSEVVHVYDAYWFFSMHVSFHPSPLPSISPFAFCKREYLKKPLFFRTDCTIQLNLVRHHY